MLASQIILLAFATIRFVGLIKIDIEGRPAKEPQGFIGVIGSILAYAIILVLYYFSGALSLII